MALVIPFTLSTFRAAARTIPIAGPATVIVLEEDAYVGSTGGACAFCEQTTRRVDLSLAARAHRRCATRDALLHTGSIVARIHAALLGGLIAVAGAGA